jgi:hypothetical protein
MEGENEWGEIYTSLLATQVRFAHLLRSQGDKPKIIFSIICSITNLEVRLIFGPMSETHLIKLDSSSICLLRGVCKNEIDDVAVNL